MKTFVPDKELVIRTNGHARARVCCNAPADAPVRSYPSADDDQLFQTYAVWVGPGEPPAEFEWRRD